MERRKWLCVAYAFPPINRSGAFRTSAFVQHLHGLGWDATVLTVEPGEEPVDSSLLDSIPASTAFVRTPWVDIIQTVKGGIPGWFRSGIGTGTSDRTPEARRAVGEAGIARTGWRAELRDWASRLLMTPDSRNGWIWPAYRAGLAAARKSLPEVIYSTSPYESAHLIAFGLSRRLGIPWVADFRDPWRANPFREGKFASLRWIDGWLERRVVRRADYIVCNTPTMRDEFCKRYPFVAKKSRTILNGFDQRSVHSVIPLRSHASDCFVMTHVGQFYGRRDPAIWMRALRHAMADGGVDGRRLRLQFVGPPAFDGVPLGEIAQREGVADFVDVVEQVGQAEALGYAAGSDAAILAGNTDSGGDLQVPNKLFEYLALRRPIIANVAATSPVCAILEDADADAVITHTCDPIALSKQMLRLLNRKSVDVAYRWGGVNRYDRCHRAAELADVFSKVCRETSRQHPLRQEQKTTAEVLLKPSMQQGRAGPVGCSAVVGSEAK